MNVLQVNPDGSRERRAIPDDWARSYDVPVRERFLVNIEEPLPADKPLFKTLRYRNTGLETSGLTVFLTDAHQLDVARIESAFPTHEPRTSAETTLRNEMIEFIQQQRIDRKDVLSERLVDIPNPHGEPRDLIYSIRMEWVTLKAVS